MRRFLADVLEVVRPFGLRRLWLICAMLFAQAIIQLLSVFSFLPFLNAASNIQNFRHSQIGGWFVHLIGGGSDRRVIVLTGVTSLATLIFSNVNLVATDYIRGRYAHSMGHSIRLALFSKILSRKYEYFTGINVSVLLKITIEDVANFVQQILLSILEIMSRSMLTLMLGIAVVLFEPVVAGSALAALAIFYLAVVIPIRSRAARTSDSIQIDIRRLYFDVTQILSGIKPILATNRQNYFIQQCDRASRALSREMPKVPVYSIVPRSALEIVVFGGLILWVLLSVVSGGDLVSIMPRVGLIAIIAYRLMPSLQLIFGQSMNVTANRQSMTEVLHLLREQDLHAANPGSDPVREGKIEWQNSIRLENVTFAYRGAEDAALREINLSIAKGSHVAFVGTTGSGKSTLVDLLLGLLQPSDGKIFIDEHELAPAQSPAWRNSVGYVPQDLFLLDASIAENVAFGCDEDELDFARVREVVAQAHALAFVEQRPEGLNSGVGERGMQLSGGQRQRLAVARALYGRPSVLILDEATSALDPATEEKMLAAIAQPQSGVTIITVTHRVATVKDCDCIYLLDHGRIVAVGTYQQLLHDENFRRYLREAH